MDSQTPLKYTLHLQNVFFYTLLQVLVDDALVAGWVREGLPSDPTSIQNGTILTNSERWPLMLDPQLQGPFLIFTPFTHPHARYYVDQRT